MDNAEGRRIDLDQAREAVRGHVEDIIDVEGLSGIRVIDVQPYGSRRYGAPRPDSDLDMAVEYSGNVPEDDLFGLIHAYDLEIAGVRVDINPITEGKSGTMAEYLTRAQRYYRWDTSRVRGVEFDVLYRDDAPYYAARRGDGEGSPAESRFDPESGAYVLHTENREVRGTAASMEEALDALAGQIGDERHPGREEYLSHDAPQAARTFEIAGVSGETWRVTVEATDRAQAAAIAERALSAMLSDDEDPLDIPGVKDAALGEEADHTLEFAISPADAARGREVGRGRSLFLDKTLDRHSTLVVNLFGGPGAGKTVGAWDIASELKKRGFVAEYVPEYAKELAWDRRWDKLEGTLENQEKMFAEQVRRVDRLMGQVDFIVTDSPTILGAQYLEEADAEFEARALDDFRSRPNFNLIVRRGATYEREGRIHSERQAREIDGKIRAFLDGNGIYYGTYSHEQIEKAVDNMIVTHRKLEERMADLDEAHRKMTEPLLAAGWPAEAIAGPWPVPTEISDTALLALVGLWVDSDEFKSSGFCRGEFWSVDEKGQYTAVDNTAGECFVERFKTEGGMRAYLLHGADVMDAMAVDKGEMTLDDLLEREERVAVDWKARADAAREASDVRDLLAAYDAYIAAASDSGIMATGWQPVGVSEFSENEYLNVWKTGGDFGYLYDATDRVHEKDGSTAPTAQQDADIEKNPPFAKLRLSNPDFGAFPWALFDWRLGVETGRCGIDLGDGDSEGFDRPSDLDAAEELDSWLQDFRAEAFRRSDWPSAADLEGAWEAMVSMLPAAKQAVSESLAVDAPNAARRSRPSVPPTPAADLRRARSSPARKPRSRIRRRADSLENPRRRPRTPLETRQAHARRHARKRRPPRSAKRACAKNAGPVE